MTERTAGRGGLTPEHWWTPGRTRAAGLAGILGGLGATALSVGRSGVGMDLGAVNVLYPVGYVLFVATLLAADARYADEYRGRGRTVAGLFGFALAAYALSVVVLVAGRALFGTLFVPLGGFVGAAFLGARLLASAYGVVLWGRTDANRLAAGLFALTFPAIFLLGPLAVVGLPALWVEGPLYLAFVALGYDCWTAAGAGASGGASEVSG
ncbi:MULTISPECIES: hypothetical protein [Halorussus]|uniref:hypothetical protein n=1 Tax=Halorussus TaxID=1070314 RepID=UPI00209CE17F|nr:hypothetical protein [Halorussus vallis]USZ74235.1 hypothetical protein NGM07_12350 [Halorussus vallis]